MTNAIVRRQSPEEREFARYVAEIERRKRHAAMLQDDLTSLRLALILFEAEYRAAVGSLFLELDRVRLAIRGYEEKIIRLHDDEFADPVKIEKEVGEGLRAEREGLNEQERENRRYEQALQQRRKRRRLPSEEEAELHRFYRELAKRFHPDLARTEEERHRREPIMQRVNAAMREADLAAMRALLSEAEFTDPSFEARPIGEKLVWAIREIARLDELIVALEHELATLRNSSSYDLWQRQEAGERVIPRLTENLRRDLAEAQEDLATLVATYQRLVKARGH